MQENIESRGKHIFIISPCFEISQHRVFLKPPLNFQLRFSFLTRLCQFLLARSPSMVFKYWILATFRIACLRMNSSEARLSWPEWRIKNGESIERSHACILQQRLLCFPQFHPYFKMSWSLSHGWIVKFSLTYQAATLTKKGKRKILSRPRRVSDGVGKYFDVSDVSHDYLRWLFTPVMDEQDAPIRRWRGGVSVKPLLLYSSRGPAIIPTVK